MSKPIPQLVGDAFNLVGQHGGRKVAIDFGALVINFFLPACAGVAIMLELQNRFVSPAAHYVEKQCNCDLIPQLRSIPSDNFRNMAKAPVQECAGFW